MQSSIYLLSIVAAVSGLWFLWTLGLKLLFLDMYRERLFELRFKLFLIGATGELSFDNDAYRAVEALLCGLLRFGHRITFTTYVFSSIEQSRAKREDRDYEDVSQQIALKISRLGPETQQKIGTILSQARSTVLLYMAFTSLIFVVAFSGWVVLKVLGLRRPSKAKLSHPVEQEVYRAEMRRPLRPVAA